MIAAPVSYGTLSSLTVGKGNGVMRLRGDRLSWREIDDEIVALDLETSTYFTANATASTVIRRLSTGAETSDLVVALVEEFDVDDATATSGVEAILRDLDQMGLLEREDG